MPPVSVPKKRPDPRNTSTRLRKVTGIDVLTGLRSELSTMEPELSPAWAGVVALTQMVWLWPGFSTRTGGKTLAKGANCWV